MNGTERQPGTEMSGGWGGGRRKPLPPPLDPAFHSPRGSAPRIAHVVFLFQKAFSSPVTVEGAEVWSVVTAGCPWLHHIFVFLLKKQPQI